MVPADVTPPWEGWRMAFGQQSGPPASARQVKDLTRLVMNAGHVDFRDARGPLGLTQRQASGKFTRDEADALIALLEEAEDAHRAGLDPAAVEDLRAVDAPPPADLRLSADDRRHAEQRLALRDVADDLLAAELQQRGWVVMAP